jgi:hypothetical protein
MQSDEVPEVEAIRVPLVSCIGPIPVGSGARESL